MDTINFIIQVWAFASILALTVVNIYYRNWFAVISGGIVIMNQLVKWLIEWSQPGILQISEEVNQIKVEIDQIKSDVNELRSDVNELKSTQAEILTILNELLERKE